MRLIDADALAKEIKQDIVDEGLTERYVFYRIKEAPTIEPRHGACWGCQCVKMEKLQPELRHGLLIPDATLPRKGCYHCWFREGNLCKFLPASVPVVECGKRYERHKECPLVEV